MDNEVIEDDDDINLELFGDKDNAPPEFGDKNHPIHVEDEELPFLDHEEIENALYEEKAYPIEEGTSSHVQGG